MSFPSRFINRSYQIRSIPKWIDGLFSTPIGTYNMEHPKAVRTNNFLSSKKPKNNKKK